MAAAEHIGLQPVQAAAGGGPPLDEEESVLATFERVQLLAAAQDLGEGTLFITQWRVFWLAAAAGYSVDFAAIVMHAVASDDESFGKPCLYCQLDSEEEGEGGLGGSGSGSEEEEGEGGQADVLPEMRLIPADAAQLDDLFQAFCEGAERNPDWSEDEEEEGEGGGVFFDEDEVLAGAAAASLGMGDVDELVGQDPGRFEDAEGDEFEEFEQQAAAAAGGSERQPNGGC
ncbi:chloride conductance regulatory ICln-like isoform X1 [Chlorella sorokiniana]|uniref:Chloride conductance regulatory ICln-like isoform X1 n=1 Tax=Chlorella sorokiniana TaxID=3076 RepID=A0A2P6TYV6_CHLSO|nr:chloride conductance regulatory ICln-like isoform X1 [Chlorella sorokiniana]|eukprot:PRW59239.1 chloride conductance regulatory ICln-like isoform X1 [Chlorella sorokiniana]